MYRYVERKLEDAQNSTSDNINHEKIVKSHTGKSYKNKALLFYFFIGLCDTICLVRELNPRGSASCNARLKS